MLNPAPADASAAERILVLAPIGKDAALIVKTLDEAGIAASATADLADLASRVQQHMPTGPGGVIIGEEALDPRKAGPFIAALASQPAWSDLPVVVVTTGGPMSPRRLKVLDAFGPAGSLTHIERPFQALTLSSAIQVALRSRRRQYQVRDLVSAQEQAARDLVAKAAELERSNAELEQFAAVASHDLQEPLRMITSYLAILQRRYATLFDGKAQEYFGFVTDGAHRMQAMIQAILDYSKVGQDGVAFSPIDSTAALGDALDAMDAKLKEAGAQITADSLPRVRSNRVLLSQVFQNLISNAIKFCDQKPSIKISVQESPGEWVFSVADNGIGMPREGLDRVFKLFQRLHAGERYRGTGIGLATCKKIIDFHGGRIWVESTESLGSIFFFSLPK